MGDVGNFLFGGGKSEQSGQNQSSNQSQSSSESTNNSVQASASGSNNMNFSGSSEYNQAYAPLSAALTPTLGYVSSAGNMMASLLGLPTNTFSYEQTPFTPPPPPTFNPGDTNINLPPLEDIIDALAGSTPTLPPPAPTPAPNPNTPTPPPPPPAAPPPAAPPPAGNPFAGIPLLDPNYGGGGTGTSRGGSMSDSLLVQPLAQGGRARPGRAYLVGENEPEVFVPDQPGTVVPGPMGAAGYQGRTGRGDWREQVMQRLTSRGIAAPPGWGPSPTTPPATPGTSGTPAPTAPTTGTPTVPAPTTGTPAPAANPGSALETFSDSAGMNFILDQGQKAISGASAANGVFNSGATGKALVQYGQNLGQTYLNQYMQYLNQLGQLGLGSASAMSNAGGVSSGQSGGGGQSSSVSGGLSSGRSTSSGNSSGTSSGTTSGEANNKNGLLPAVVPLI